MEFDSSRLRRGEAVAGAGAVTLLVLMLVLQWYGPRADGARPVAAATGWEAYTVWRWFALAAVIAVVALVYAQGTRRAPALPVSFSVICLALSIIVVVWLGFRVLLDHPPHQQVGAFVSLLAAVALLVGSYLSTRQEGIAERDAPAEIPLVRL